jgi:hypothetical protein
LEQITGLRPGDCYLCTWGIVKGVSTLRFIHDGCAVHGHGRIPVQLSA